MTTFIVERFVPNSKDQPPALEIESDDYVVKDGMAKFFNRSTGFDKQAPVATVMNVLTVFQKKK